MKKINIPKTKIHTYNVSVAMDVGVNAAVIFYNICYWVEENSANKRNFINGKYWTYNTIKAFQSLFPEMSYNQIQYALKKLEEKKYIESAYLNDDPYKRIKYYTVCDAQSWIMENSNMESGTSNDDNYNYNNKDNDSNNKQEANNNNSNDSHKKVSDESEIDYKVSGQNEPEIRTDKLPYNYTKEQIASFIKEKITSLMNKLYHEPDVEDCQKISKVISFFYECYYKNMGKRHPIMSDDAYIRIINKMLNPIDAIYELDVVMDVDSYEAMIEQFFLTTYGVKSGNNTDYRIGYFFSDKVHENLAHRSLK